MTQTPWLNRRGVAVEEEETAIATSAESRFWAKVDKSHAEGCWIWTGSKNENGYGAFVADGHFKAHRFIWAATNGPIPEGLEIDHLCANPSCVRPDHLDAVTREENMRRRRGRLHTHCRQGHPFDEANTRIRPNGRRICLTCTEANDRALRASREACYTRQRPAA